VAPQPLLQWYQEQGFNRVEPIEYKESEWFSLKPSMLWNLDRVDYVFPNDLLHYAALFDYKKDYPIEIEPKFQLFVGGKNSTTEEKLDWRLKLSPDHPTDGISYAFYVDTEGINRLNVTLTIINGSDQEILDEINELIKFDVNSPNFMLQDKINYTTSNALMVSIAVGLGTLTALGLTALFSRKAVNAFEKQNQLLENRHLREQKLKHSTDLISVYDSMLSVVCRKNYYEKKLSLNIPKNKEDIIKIKYGMMTAQEIIHMEYVELNIESVENLNFGIEHMENMYPTIFEKWSKVSQIQNSYNEKVKEIFEIIEKKTKEALENEFPNYVESSGFSHASYSTKNIIHSIFNMLEDISEDKEPDTHIDSDYFNEEKMWFIRKNGVTIFEGPEQIDFDELKIQNVLGCCFNDDDLEQQFQELNDFHEEANHALHEMRTHLDELIRFLKAGGLIKGECSLGY